MLAFKKSTAFHSPKDWTSPELKEIDSLLRCPICYDFLHTAMILPDCSHTFCSFCIRHHLSHTNKCPICNKSACENNLRNNRLVDDLIVEFESVRPRLLEITKKLTAEKSGTGRHVNKIMSQETKTQNEVSLKQKTAPNDDIIDLVSEDGDERESTRVDTKCRENKENIGGVDQGLHTKSSLQLSDVNSAGEFSSPSTQVLHTPRAKSGVQLSDVDKTGEFSSPRSQDSSSEGFLSPQRKTVPCPVCGISLRGNVINDHLDLCLGGEERKSALRKQTPKRKPMAKLVYHLMSERDIKKKLKEVGLSTAGEKKVLVRRHYDFVMLYNSECDSLKPRSVQDIVKEVEKTEDVRNRTRKDSNRLVIEKNSSPASIEKAQKHYMKKHKSHFSCLIEETRKRMREQKEKKRLSMKERRKNRESQTETCVAESSNIEMELTLSESDCEARRETPGGHKRNKGAATGGCEDIEMSENGERNVSVVSSRSETERGGRRSNRNKKKPQLDTSVEDSSDIEIVSLQSDSESGSRKSQKCIYKPDVNTRLKTTGSSIKKNLIDSEEKIEREGNSIISGTFRRVGNVTSDKNDTPEALAQTGTCANLRRKSRRNQSKGGTCKNQPEENQSIQDREESGHEKTRRRNKRTADKEDNSVYDLTDVMKSDDNQADVSEDTGRRRTRRIIGKSVSKSGSSSSKKTNLSAEMENDKAETVPERKWQGLSQNKSERKCSSKPSRSENEDNLPIFEAEKRITRAISDVEKNCTLQKRSQNSSTEGEMVDGNANKPLPIQVQGNETDCNFTTVPVDFSQVKWNDDEMDEKQESRLQKQFLGSPLRIPDVNKASSTAAENDVEISLSDTVDEAIGGKGPQQLKASSGESKHEGECNQKKETEADDKDEGLKMDFHDQ